MLGSKGSTGSTMTGNLSSLDLEINEGMTHTRIKSSIDDTGQGRESRNLLLKRTRFAKQGIFSMSPSEAASTKSSGYGSKRNSNSSVLSTFTNVIRAVHRSKQRRQLKKMRSASSADKISGGGEKEYCNLEDSPIYILKVCSLGNIEKVDNMLIDNPKLLRVEDNKGYMCMHHAVSKGQITVIDVLLSHGADINMENKLNGDTPLHYAVERNRLDSVIHLLTKTDLNPSLLNKKGFAPIHSAVVLNKTAILEELLKSDKIDKEIRGIHGKMAVHFAAALNHEKCMQILMNFGCRLCVTCGFGYYPMHKAARAASSKALLLMLQNGSLTTYGYTKEFLLNLADKESATPLHLAVNSGDPETVRICLENGAKVETAQENKATALHFACAQGSLTIVQILYEAYTNQEHDEETYQNILELKDCLNMTPLHRAALYNHDTVVRYLIEKKANIEALDSQRRTPLMVAAVRGGGSRSFLTLLNAGANEQVEDINNRTLLHYLVMYWTTSSGHDLSYLRRICDKQASGENWLNKKDHFGSSPLHMAAKDGNLKFTDALINLGAVINLKDNEEQTPLHYSAKFGCLNAAKRLLDSPTGQNVINEADHEGMTALHIASQYGHTKIVQLLLRKGAMIHRDHFNRTSMHLATQNGYTDTMQILLSFHHNLLDTRSKNGNTPLHFAAEFNQAACIELLLSANCKYRLNDEFKSPIDLAIDNQSVAAAKAMVQHERWNEILSISDVRIGCPIYRLIEHVPEVYKVILDRSFTTSENEQHVNKVSSGYWEKYNFTYLDVEIDKRTEYRREGVHVSPLGSLNMMVKCGRIQLLLHPVCLQYLNTKWLSYGYWVFVVNILLYLIFLASLTHSVLLWHRRLVFYHYHFNNTSSISVDDLDHALCNSAKDQTSRFNVINRLAMIYICVYSAISILKEIMKIFLQTCRYLTDFTNYIETALFVNAFKFSMLSIRAYTLTASSMLFDWQCGCISLFIAWLNLLLFMQRLDSIGLYIVMFRQILKTIVKVWAIFAVLFVAFGLTFHLLLMNESQVDFRLPFIAIFQSVMMMMGDWNYVDVFAKPYYNQSLVYPMLTFGFLLVFVILMPILFINLLIGLAVGDIEIVQKDASLKRLAMQVEYHTELENRMPNSLSRKLYKKEIVLYPNGKGPGAVTKTDEDHLCRKHDDRTAKTDENKDQFFEELQKTKQNVKEIKQNMDHMHDMLHKIVNKMEISLDEDEHTTSFDHKSLSISQSHQ